MNGKTTLKSIKLSNFLSFGSEGIDIDLLPLNMLVGTNGSGKSNFIEAIRLLKSTPTNIATPIAEGGGVSEWLWKGNNERSPMD